MAAHGTESQAYREALRMFDEAHREDPRKLTVGGEKGPLVASLSPAVVSLGSTIGRSGF